jgi:hypothetical protein
MLIAFGVMIVVGFLLLLVPTDETEMLVEAREDVSIYWSTGTMANIVLPRGDYQIWIEDKDPEVQDYGHFIFTIHSIESEVDIVYSDGSIIENIDGTPHELYCSFVLDRSDMFFYDTETSNIGGEEEYFEIVFTRGDRWTDRPFVWGGVAITVIGVTAIGLILGEHYTRSSRSG